MAQFIADICAANGVPRKACLRLTLLVEELFTNTVVHGHGADTESLYGQLLKVAKRKTAQADVKFDESGNAILEEENEEEYGDNVLIVKPEIAAPAAPTTEKKRPKK